MRFVLLAGLAFASMAIGTAHAAEWRVQRIYTPARVSAIDTVGQQVRINAGGLWYAIAHKGERTALTFIDATPKLKLPNDALPDGRVATGTHDIARVWLAEPTDRYSHGVLGDKVEAGSLVIEGRDGKRYTVRLKDDAVFEDLEPRLADLDGDGQDSVIVVKSYLKRGSALAIIEARKGGYGIVAETPPLGGQHRWLNPAGIGDFLGDGSAAIAVVRQPHIVGELELWSWRDGKLQKSGEMSDFSNHITGTRATGMSAAADFDGDGVTDLALPSLDRTRLRIVSFAPQPREIASIALPAKAVTNFGLIARDGGPPLIALGLEDGSLVAAAAQ